MHYLFLSNTLSLDPTHLNTIKQDKKYQQKESKIPLIMTQETSMIRCKSKVVISRVATKYTKKYNIGFVTIKIWNVDVKNGMRKVMMTIKNQIKIFLRFIFKNSFQSII